jgi:transcriptional regulator with XRE-family HTH domain
MPGLRELRAKKRLSLEAVGYLANLDPATVSRVERGLVVSVGRMREVLVESLEEASTGEPGP